MSEKPLRRYTNIPSLIYLLQKQVISLLDPRSWNDTNDSYYLRLYKEKKHLDSVLAVCFTQAQETYHHWGVFASGSSGVCIRFKRSQLLQAIKNQDGIIAKRVRYLTLPEIRDKELAVSELPFLKRQAYENEDEFRVIYESPDTRKSILDIPIPLTCVERITLSPWIHPELSPHTKKLIRRIDGCSKLDIVRSTLIGNEEWKSLGERAKLDPQVTKSS